jgi:hypothetical protein
VCRDLGRIAAQRAQVPGTDEDTVLVGISGEGFDEQGKGVDVALVPEDLLEDAPMVKGRRSRRRDLCLYEPIGDGDGAPESRTRLTPWRRSDLGPHRAQP